jgi:hypothetical protein
MRYRCHKTGCAHTGHLYSRVRIVPGPTERRGAAYTACVAVMELCGVAADVAVPVAPEWLCAAAPVWQHATHESVVPHLLDDELRSIDWLLESLEDAPSSLKESFVAPLAVPAVSVSPGDVQWRCLDGTHTASCSR